ncbi:hypothetical protein [Burkholderia vietnamiensis]|uniref:hypothetical protein n=2 Tax=Burkholderia vietnamiensis TaxID=60552 RepID=UPI0030B855D5
MLGPLIEEVSRLGVLFDGKATEFAMSCISAAPVYRVRNRCVSANCAEATADVPRDEQSGLRYLTQAAEAGNRAADVSVGFYLNEHHMSFAGKTGLQRLEDLANRKVAAAYSALGSAYWRTQPAIAFDWFTRGAMLDDAASQAMLCSMYLDGNGTLRNPANAAHWCRAAAAGNIIGAMRMLASVDAGLVAADERAYW